MACAQEARETAEAVARRSYGKLIAFLAARTGDVAAAEDALALRPWVEAFQGLPITPPLDPSLLNYL